MIFDVFVHSLEKNNFFVSVQIQYIKMSIVLVGWECEKSWAVVRDYGNSETPFTVGNLPFDYSISFDARPPSQNTIPRL